MLYFLLILSTLAMAQPYLKSDLEAQEIKLKKQFLELKKSSMSPRLVSSLLFRTATPAEKKKILQWYKTEKAFQQSYDAFQNKKLKYMADLVRAEGACLRDAVLKKDVSTADRRLIKERWNALLEQQKRYEGQQSLFGTKEDYLRVLAYNDLYRAQEAYVAALEDGLDIATGLGIESGYVQLAEKMFTLPQIAKVMYALNFQKHSGQGETPILDAIGEGVRAMGNMYQVKANLKGLENMPEPVYDGKTLNIIAFEHANSYLDTIVQAHIPADQRRGIGFFGAAKYVFPASWVKNLEESDHYIVVNQGKEIPRTMEIIQSRKLHGFFAAAEGLTPAGLMETRPVSPLFTDTFWELKKRGLEINLVPMSYPDNFRLYNAWKSNLKVVATGVVSPMLSDFGSDELLKLTGEKESVGIWLRSTWHETLKNDDKLFLSAPSLSSLESSIENRLWSRINKKISSSCHH